MWKRVRDGIGGFLKKMVSSPFAGAILWAIFVGRITPPGTSDLMSAFLVVTSTAGICILSKGMCEHLMKKQRKESFGEQVES